MTASRARWALAAVTLWVSWVAYRYVALVERLPQVRLQLLWADLQGFWVGQLAGFGLLVIGVGLVRPAWVGRLSALWLVGSTIVLLAIPGTLGLPVGFLAFLLFWLAATRSVQLGLARFVGRAQASWAIAATALWAAAIPVAFFLGLCGILSRGPVLVLAGVVAIPGAMDLLRRVAQGWRALVQELDRLGPLAATALEVAWLFLALTFVWACGPEASSDSIRSYLPEVQSIARHHGFDVQTVDPGRLLPRAVQAVEAMGYVLGGQLAAKWLSWVALVVLFVLIVEEVGGRSKSRTVSLWAGATTLACPLLLFLSTTLMYDHVITLFCVAGFCSLFRATREDSTAGVLLSAGLLGCALPIKYNLLVFASVWSAFVAFFAWRRWGFVDGSRWLVRPAAVLVILAAPWFLYTWWLAGNPLFPFFDGIFDSPYWASKRPVAAGVERFRLGGPLDRLAFPWTITFHSSRISQGADGRLGFQLLAWLPAVVFLRRGHWKAGLDLLLAGVMVVTAVCLMTPYARYWLPGYPLLLMPLFLALGRGFAWSGWRPPRAATFLAAGWLVATTLLVLPMFAAHFPFLPWDVYRGAIADDTWVEQRNPGVAAIQELNRRLLPEERVLVTGFQAVFTVDGDAYEFPFFTTRTLALEDSEALASRLQENRIRYWVVDYSVDDAPFFEGRFDVADRYWHPGALIAASGSVAVFDLDPDIAEPAFVRVDRQRPRLLRNGGADEADRQRPGSPAPRWLELGSGDRAAARFGRPPGSDLLALEVDLGRGTGDWRGVRISLQWSDENGDVLAEGETGRFRSVLKTSRRRWWMPVPAGARRGRLVIRYRGQGVVQVGEVEVIYLSRSALSSSLSSSLAPSPRSSATSGSIASAQIR